MRRKPALGRRLLTFAALLLVSLTQVRADTLFDQTVLVDVAKAAPDASDLSVMQADVGSRVLGFAASGASATRLADDFKVPAEGWLVTGISVYAFQPDATAKQPSIDGLNFRIWKGEPEAPGSSVVFGDTSTNRFATARFAELYRVAGKAGDRSKPMFVVSSAPFALALEPGTYWLDVQLDGAQPAGPFVPPMPLPTDGANALHLRGGAWSRLDDAGYPQALPIRISGRAGLH